MSNSREQQMLEELTQQMLDEAKVQGATAAEAASSIESGYSTSVRMGEIDTIEHHKDNGMGISVYFGKRKGSASTSDFSAASVKEAVRAACDIARYTEEDEYAGLADPENLATEFPDLELEHSWSVGVEESVELAKECEQAALEYDERIINSEGGSVSSHHSVRVYGNSNGFLAGYRSSQHSISCSVVAQELSSNSSDGMQRDYWYSAARDPEALANAEDVGRIAAERTVNRLGSRKGKTQRSPIIFAAPIAGTLIRHLLSAVSGGALYRKASFLLDSLGEQLFPDFINISEKPHLHRGVASASFDSDGVATVEKDIISGGVLSSYLLNSYAARRLNMESSGNGGGARNVRVNSSKSADSKLSLKDMLQDMDRGFLVTELMGQGVNGITGDYSRGAAGFWVDGGEIVYPIDELTIAGNLKDMFKQIVSVGTDVDCRGNIQSGSILLESMSLAS
ncbi:MAG: metalloprotease PmbA [Thiotrichales bacterium]|jgi:PmbA protein|nr:metalloprotease PmbA [Thiotrichales bacterium]MBT5418928.1 metalloprotease PmbA [Thiotrichales bacterium]MBT6617343.1 metalloprotease PmbA [Thiotrichales bacterium]MBT7869660.1 metalloprotease PmbA [Thiotrichales bacterium]